MVKKQLLLRVLLDKTVHIWLNFCWEKDMKFMVWYGIMRRASYFNTERIEHMYFDEWIEDIKQNRQANLHYGNMTDSSSLIRIIQSIQPDEIYNLAAQHRKASSDFFAPRD